MNPGQHSAINPIITCLGRRPKTARAVAPALAPAAADDGFLGSASASDMSGKHVLEGLEKSGVERYAYICKGTDFYSRVSCDTYRKAG